jgi:hypothetical protein
MTTAVKSPDAFKPNYVSICFAEDGSMKIEIFNLKIHEAKELIEKINNSIRELEK